MLPLLPWLLLRVLLLLALETTLRVSLLVAAFALLFAALLAFRRCCPRRRRVHARPHVDLLAAAVVLRWLAAHLAAVQASVRKFAP